MRSVDHPVATDDSTNRAINLRVSEDVRDLIDRAAQSQDKSHAEFIIDAARRAAEDALLDQTLVRSFTSSDSGQIRIGADSWASLPQPNLQTV